MRYIIIYLLLFIFLSCDPSTAIRIVNKTDYQIMIECKTIYDEQSDEVEMLGGRLMRYIRLESGYFVIQAGPVLLQRKEGSNIIGKVGYNIIRELGYGSIENIDDIISAIDEIFIELNIFIYDNGEKTLLYDKNYFLNEQNINLDRKRFIRIVIE